MVWTFICLSLKDKKYFGFEISLVLISWLKVLWFFTQFYFMVSFKVTFKRKSWPYIYSLNCYALCILLHKVIYIYSLWISIIILWIFYNFIDIFILFIIGYLDICIKFFSMVKLFMCILFACMHDGAPFMLLMPAETRRRLWIKWN